MWAGVMAALNGKRLGSALSVWLPLGLGFGYLALDIGLGAIFDSNWLSVFLYVGAVAVLWGVVLKPQSELFATWRSSTGRSGGSWIWPAIAGAPLALLAFYGFVLEPLRPLEPREVCERFWRARSEEEMKKYVTLNLWPALNTLAKPSNTKAKSISHFEMLSDGLTPPGVGGYFVEFRTINMEGGRDHRTEGVFHLFQQDGNWKIEEVYLTSQNRRPWNPWFAISKEYPSLQIGPQDQGPLAMQPHPPERRPEVAPQEKKWFEQPAVAEAAGKGIIAFLSTKAGKRTAATIGFVLVGIVVTIGRFGKSLLAMFKSDPQPQQG